MLLLILLSAASNEPASQPVPMLQFTLGMVRQDVHNMGCTDSACWKRSALRLDDGLSTAIKAMAFYEERLSAKEQMLVSLQARFDVDQKTLADSLKPLQDEAKELSQPLPFYKEPAFWFVTGMVSATVLIGGGVAVGKAFLH